MADDDFSEGESAVSKALQAELEKGEGKVVREPAKGKKKPTAASGEVAAPDVRTPAEAFVDGAGRFIEKTQPTISALPPDAPVRALGTFGNRVYFLDAHSQLRELAAKDVSRTMILHLFGSHVDWIYRLWPTLAKVPSKDTWIVTGWDGTKAQESLMTACARKGVWRPQDHVRGRGAWATSEGLLVHAGGRLYASSGQSARPGLIGDMVYPAAPMGLAPAEAGGDGKAAAHDLLDHLKTWNWARPYDPLLLLGWMISAMMGGAIKVRPLAWVTGEKGTGKSSLVGEGGVIHKVFGSGILMTANTTAAGLYQKIGYDSLPVAVDEIEAKRGNQKTEAVIELARQAYSGGMVLRGGADHEGKEFRAMCPVLFGSILIPPLMPQDLSRLALLNLRPFEPGATAPVLEEKRLAEIGRTLLRRLLDRWTDWPERLAAWHGYLVGLGHSSRAADQFGTLLAAADLILHDQVPTQSWMDQVAGSMKPQELHETQVESSNASRCIGYAMSRPLTSMRGGENMMVSELVACAVRRFGGEMESPVTPLNATRYLERAGVTVVGVQMAYGEDGAARLTATKASRMPPGVLQKMVDEPVTRDEGIFVAFAPSGDGILELFKNSDWEGVPGAHNPYVQALERVIGARRAAYPLRIGGQVCKAILIPIHECIDVPSIAEASQKYE